MPLKVLPACRDFPWGVMGPHPTPGSTAAGYSEGRETPHNFWLWKLAGIAAQWDRRLLESQVHLLINSLPLSSSTGAADEKASGRYKEELACLESEWGLEGQLSPRQKCWQILLFLVEPFYHPTGRPRQVTNLSLYQPGLHQWPHSIDSLRPCPTKLARPPKLVPAAFKYKWAVLVPGMDFPKISQRFTNPKQVATHLSMPCTSC